MTTYKKTVAESIGVKETDIDIVVTSQLVWDTTSPISTTWDVPVTLQKDE